MSTWLDPWDRRYTDRVRLLVESRAFGASCTTWRSARRPSARQIEVSWRTRWHASWRADAVGRQADGAMVMVHDFTLVHALNPELDSQDEVLRQLVGSDCVSRNPISPTCGN